MLGWFSSNQSNGPSSEKYSLKALQDLYTTLAKNQDLGAGNQDVLVEAVRAVAEVIVYGDQNTDLLFDYFCEKNMFPLLLGLLDHPNCGAPLKVQIIQSVSILVLNIRSETSLYYTLSNNHVNRLISHGFDFSNEEILDQYISFLKTLSLRLNEKTIQFFFNDRLNSFPLFEEAIKLFDHPEGMVQTSVRTTILNIFRVKDERMQNWLLSGPAAQFVEQMVRFMHKRCRHLHLLLLRTYQHREKKQSKSPEDGGAERRTKRHEGDLRGFLLRLEGKMEEQQNNFLFLEDITSLNVPGLENIVINSSMAYFFLPLLLSSLLPQTVPFTELDGLEERDFTEAGVSREEVLAADSSCTGSLLSLSLLAHAFFTFTNPHIINRLVEAMFLPIPTDLFGKDERDTGSPLVDASQDVLGPQGEDDDSDGSSDTDGVGSLLVDEGTTSLSRRESSAGDGNRIHSSFLSFLRHKNERHCLAAVCVIYALTNNPNVNTNLLIQAGLVTEPSSPESMEELEELGEHDRKQVEQHVREIIHSVVANVSGEEEVGVGEKEEGNQTGNPREPKVDHYPHHIVDALLDLLNREPSLSTIAQRVVAKLIIDFTCKESDPSNARLTNSHLKKLDSAYARSVQRLQSCFDQEIHKKCPTRLLEMIEMEWQCLCDEGPLRVESLMTEPFTLLPADMGPRWDEEKTTLPLDSRQPFSVLESTRSVIRSFFIIRILWTSIHWKTNSLLATAASTVTPHRENQKIDLRNVDYTKVSVLEAQGGHAAIQPAFLVLAGGTLMLVEPDRSVLGKGLIRTVAPLHRLQFTQHFNDDLKMHIVVRTPPKHSVGWAHRDLPPLVSNSLPSTPEIFVPYANAGATGNGKQERATAESKTIPSSEVREGMAETPWAWPKLSEEEKHRPDSSSDLRKVHSWYLTIRFDDHGSLYWVKDQLSRAIDATVKTRLRRFRSLLSTSNE